MTARRLTSSAATNMLYAWSCVTLVGEYTLILPPAFLTTSSKTKFLPVNSLMNRTKTESSTSLKSRETRPEEFPPDSARGVRGSRNPHSTARKQTREACLIHLNCPKGKKSMIYKQCMRWDRSFPGPRRAWSRNGGPYHKARHRHNQTTCLLQRAATATTD